ncbi:conserved hypothetical protein [Candidatus Desulfosporosinus infrequens]|uniref:Uncharacterized protein n=1 Tax=Candidatus Desulfosporosinus infrequens TaxID=2043169 RepID=A0A2U3L502_9FIRM|nr:conserved hypothetical protein [Candidatus Desulfosporosinus infrequens]
MHDIPDSDFDSIAKDIEEKAKQPMGMVSFNDLFTPSFMTSYTKFSNFNDLLEAGKYKVKSIEDFMAIQDAKFDKFINTISKFKTWEKMQSAAVAEYLKKAPNPNL